MFLHVTRVCMYVHACIYMYVDKVHVHFANMFCELSFRGHHGSVHC